MICKKTVGALPIWVAVLCLFLAGIVGPDISMAEVVVIANPSVSVNGITKNELKEIFTGKQVTWNDGQAIKPALLSQGEVHEEFIKDYIDKTTNQFTTYWRKMIFTGQGIQPRTFESPAEVVEYVVKTPGAIGYVSSSEISAGVKTLPVVEQ